MFSHQNAARLFVHHTGDDDKIGVVRFSTNATRDMELQDSSETSRSYAIDKINSWQTDDMTAIGQGIDMASEEFDEGNPDHDWRIALLSDGKQNVTPFWDEVKNGIYENIVIDTVALGADADLDLMYDIAHYTSGVSRETAIDYCPELSFLLPSAASAAFETPETFSLANELADVYKAFAEKARMEDRIGDWSGLLDPSTGYDQEDYYVTLESGLPEVTISLNWDSTIHNGWVMLYLNDTYITSYPGGEVARDESHEQIRLINPAPGEYKIKVKESGYYWAFQNILSRRNSERI